jgi:putative Holliday junction resolvase
MLILGIDYGKKKIGLAITTGSLAEPLRTLRYRDIKILIEKVREIAQTLKVEKIVVGVSEGKMGKETRKFGERLQESLAIPIVFQDETLSTRKAQELSIEAGIKKSKRRKLEDAYSATLILQSYLDLKVKI